MTSPADFLLYADGLKKTYPDGRVQARLDGVTLGGVREGEYVAITGPSGAASRRS